MESIQRPIAQILPAPSSCSRRKELPLNFTPQRSGRIAKADCGLNSELKAKKLLLRRHGLVSDDAPISTETLAKYKRLFQRPLAHDMLQAFADLFDWRILELLDSTAGLLSPLPRVVEA